MSHCPPPTDSLPTLARASVLALLLSSCFTSELCLVNETESPLVPYPVVTTPPPPHREANPARTVAPRGEQAIDTGSFNPLYYAAGITNPLRANAVFVGLDLHDADPPQIQTKLMHYVVPPGQEGSDPALQPKVLSDKVEEVVDEDLDIRVIQVETGGLVNWRVEITPAGS